MRQEQGTRNRRTRLCSLFGPLALELLAGCGRAAPAATREAPNLLLIVVDTLGAEYLGCYGDDEALTPSLDRLAAAGVRFDRAYSTAPWTQPATASLMTSLMPHHHGVRGLLDVLPEDVSTLAEELQRSGYRTHGIISNLLIGRDFGFGQGFQEYDESNVGGHEAVTSQGVTKKAIRWIREDEDEPFFLFLHYFDPHALYNPHPRFRRTPPYHGPVRPAMDTWELRDMRDRLTEEDLAYLEGLYREEIAFTDNQIGRVLDCLEELGLDRNTLVVFTADHGEEFMRHGWIGHTRTLYDELVRVPLVFRLPGRIAPGVEDTPVSLLDVLPTTLDVLGARGSGGTLDGLSLAERLTGRGRLPDDRDVFSEVTFAVRSQLRRWERDGVVEPVEPETEPASENLRRIAQKRAYESALVRGRWKIVHDRLQDRWELYDLKGDPHELADLWGSDPELDGALRDRLRSWEEGTRTGRAPETGAPATDRALLERLDQLGY